MDDLDKAGLGERIKRIRLQAGLRQWELARRLGTTQSAVHKYEHGVVPEPRRLLELARIGDTTLEWILTGRHSENGSQDQARLSAEMLRTARLLLELAADDRPLIDEALRILRDAIRVMEPEPSESRPPGLERAVADLRLHATESRALLETAWRIQQAVLSRVSEDALARLESCRLVAPGKGAGGDRAGPV